MSLMIEPPKGFDFRAPDYTKVFERRIRYLNAIRRDPSQIPALKAFYKANPASFINDFGCTTDPRNVERNIPALVPFMLFPRQVEWLDWVVDHWKNRKPGLTEKSRDCGVSWLAVALACTLCLHYKDLAIGFGSRKEEYVDRIGAPKSLFHKARVFMSNLPEEFRGGWDANTDAPHMRLNFPQSGSHITGEAGDNIGRGDRSSIFFVDEAAYLEHPALVEAALSQTTNCRMDVSSVNGMANAFAEKRHRMKAEDVFIFDWRDDPRKDDAWYAKQVEELDPVTLAQEVDRSYTASVEGVVIPNAWIRSAIDADIKLGFAPTGARSASLDVADEGADLNALCGALGMRVELVEEWSGKGSDIFATTEKALSLCHQNNYGRMRYDADGLGAGVRGDARTINDRDLKAKGLKPIEIVAFRGSGPVFKPDSEDVKGRKNADYFANAKSQGWWGLRRRFERTHKAVTEGTPFKQDELISLRGTMRLLQKLITELSQPTYTVNTLGKILIDKAPDGVKSPNLGDSVMIQFANLSMPLRISDDAVAASKRR